MVKLPIGLPMTYSTSTDTSKHANPAVTPCSLNASVSGDCHSLQRVAIAEVNLLPFTGTAKPNAPNSPKPYAVHRRDDGLGNQRRIVLWCTGQPCTTRNLLNRPASQGHEAFPGHPLPL